MAKKFMENKSVKAEGLFSIEDMTLDIEEIGTKTLEEILRNFDGEVIRISITQNTELE